QAGECLRLGVLALVAAVRAGDLGKPGLGLATLAGLEVLDEVVGAEALVAVEALDQRVGEGGDVAGGLPDALGEDDRRVQAHHVSATAHEGLPPLPADVLLQLGAEGAVVPCGTRTAVDLTRLEHEPAVAGEGDDLVKTGLFGHGGSNGRMLGRRARDHGHLRSYRRPRRRNSGPDVGCRWQAVAMEQRVSFITLAVS